MKNIKSKNTKQDLKLANEFNKLRDAYIALDKKNEKFNAKNKAYQKSQSIKKTTTKPSPRNNSIYGSFF